MPERRKMTVDSFILKKERRGGEDRRATYSRSPTGAACLSVPDQVEKIEMFRVSPKVFSGPYGRGFNQAWIYDRRGKNYQAWQKRFADAVMRTTPKEDMPEDYDVKQSNVLYNHSDILDDVYVG